ncbi:MAG: hypothetical protein PVJ41_15795, partial [Desulfobacterales bacterium]
AAAEQADLKDYEITYITQPLTTREQLIKSFNRLIMAILNFLQTSGHPVQTIYDTVIDREAGHLLLAEDPAGLYAYCLNCIEP